MGHGVRTTAVYSREAVSTREWSGRARARAGGRDHGTIGAMRGFECSGHERFETRTTRASGDEDTVPSPVSVGGEGDRVRGCASG